MTAVRVCNDFGAQENKGDSEVDSSLRNTHLGFFSSSIRSKLWDEPVERWKESKKEGKPFLKKKKKKCLEGECINSSDILLADNWSCSHPATRSLGKCSL